MLYQNYLPTCVKFKALHIKSIRIMRKFNLKEVIPTAIAIVMFLFFMYDRYSTNLSVTLNYHYIIKEGIGDVYLNVKTINYSHRTEYLKQPVFYFVESNDTVSSSYIRNYNFEDFPLKIEYGQEVNVEYVIKGLLLENIKNTYPKNKNSEVKAIVKNTFNREFSSNPLTVKDILLGYAAFYDDELYYRIGGVPLLPQNIIK